MALVQRYHDLLNRFDAGEVATLFAEHATYQSPGIGELRGRAAIVAAMQGYFDNYPDQVAIDDSIDAWGQNAARSLWRLRATSKSTGATYERRGTETVTFDAQGLIVRVMVEDR